MRRVALLSLAAALSLAGCALPRAPQAPAAGTVTVPGRWSTTPAAADPTPLEAWWAAFGDPDLAPLIEQALAGSTDIAAARARLRQARAQRGVSASGLRPSLGGSASTSVQAAEARNTTRSAGLGLDASWEPDFWGATQAGVDSAQAGLEASAATLGATRLAVAAEVALQVLQWRGTQARLALARDNLASQQQSLRIAQWRHEAGLVNRLDVEQARAAVAQTQAQLPALETAAAQSLHALDLLTGQAPGRTRLRAAALPEPPAALSLALPAEVLRQRPDVAAAEARLRATAQQVRQAEADRLPSLRLGGSIGLSALSLAALGSGAGVVSLAASVSLPIFDNGLGAARVEAQRGAFDEAQAGYRATVLGALQDVEDTLVALAGSTRQIDHLALALEAARAAATLAEQRYASGLIDFNTVLQAQRTRLSAEDALAAARTTRLTLHVRLYKALGGGWLPESIATETAR